MSTYFPIFIDMERKNIRVFAATDNEQVNHAFFQDSILKLMGLYAEKGSREYRIASVGAQRKRQKGSAGSLPRR